MNSPKCAFILAVSCLALTWKKKIKDALFFTGMFMFMVVGILENAFILYLREKKTTFQWLKGKKFLNRFLRREGKKSKDPMAHSGYEIPKEDNQTSQLPLPENDRSDSLIFLKHLNVELQQIKKHLALEECQNDPSKSSTEDKSLLPVEMGLYYARLILSLIFLTYIIFKWTY